MAFPTSPTNGDKHVADDDTYVFNNGIWEKQKPSSAGSPVGTIVQSVLDETRFATVAPSGDWALCDGRSIAGTKLAQVTGWTTVPDLRAAYLRMGGNNASNSAWQAPAPGSYEEDTTRRPRNTAFVTNTTGNHYHSLGFFDQERRDLIQQYGNITGANASGGVNTPPRIIEDGHAGGNPAEASILELLAASSSDGRHAHQIEQGGDRETRPKSYTVYYYIKTN